MVDEILMSGEHKMNNPWDNIGGDYVKLETGKAKIMIVSNWKIEKVKKFKDEAGNLKEQDEFSCEVYSEDGNPVNKTFATTSFNALKGLKEVFSKYWPDTAKPVAIRIKRMGEGKQTVYDIEEQKFSK